MVNMDPIIETLRTYNSTAQQYAQSVDKIVLHDSLNGFVSRIMQNNSEDYKPLVIDLGCGSGRDIVELSQRNCKVVGVDFSDALLTIARQKNPDAELVNSDMRKYESSLQFDGVWANASLLHIPKEEIKNLVSNIYEMLKPRGVLFSSVKEGLGEELIEDNRYEGNPKKFFTYYEKGEMEQILEDVGFVDIESEYSPVDNPYMTHPFISIYARKQQPF